MIEESEKAMRDERLIHLNRLEVGLGCCVALIAIASAIGTWYVLPYRVSQLESKSVGIQIQIDSMQKDSQVQKELLIRIDERLKQVQQTLDRNNTYKGNP